MKALSWHTPYKTSNIACFSTNLTLHTECSIKEYGQRITKDELGSGCCQFQLDLEYEASKCVRLSRIEPCQEPNNINTLAHAYLLYVKAEAKKP